MQRIIKELENGMVQITTPDERWYVKIARDDEGIPREIVFVPSVTWIAGYYPKGIRFYKWLADKGWDEAEAIKQAAGDKGSKVHQAIGSLLLGNSVPMDGKFINKDTEEEQELTLEEYECLMSFAAWFKAVKPETLANEIVVFNDKYNYAGTVDWIGRIDDELYLLDFKTSQYIWPEYEIQVSAYGHALDMDHHKNWQGKLNFGILQLGYKKNKLGYKFTDIDDKFELFLHAKAIWQNECEGISPKQKDYPKIIQLFEQKGENTNA